MKRHFVLDENVIDLAFKGEDEFGNRDASCAVLLRSAADNCHALVLYRPFFGAYLRRINALSIRRDNIFATLMGALMLLVQDLNKDTRYLRDEDLPVIGGLETLGGVDVAAPGGVGDDLFVRAAAAVEGSILVTTDRPLTEALQSRGIDGRYGFRVIHPRESVGLAGPNSDL